MLLGRLVRCSWYVVSIESIGQGQVPGLVPVSMDACASLVQVRAAATDVSRYAFMYAKTVTLGATHWPQTNQILLKNRRIGCR